MVGYSWFALLQLINPAVPQAQPFFKSCVNNCSLFQEQNKRSSDSTLKRADQIGLHDFSPGLFRHALRSLKMMSVLL